MFEASKLGWYFRQLYIDYSWDEDHPKQEEKKEEEKKEDNENEEEES